MTTKLSDSLRALAKYLDPIALPNNSPRELLSKCIAQAEAQEGAEPVDRKGADLSVAQIELHMAVMDWRHKWAGPSVVEMKKVIKELTEIIQQWFPTTPQPNEVEAQAGELSDEEIGVIAAKHADGFDDGFMALGPKARCCRLITEALEEARDHGYLRPSQAIGEQTPVAWHGPGKFPPDPIPENHMLIGYSTRKAKDQEYGLRRLGCYAPKGPWTDGYGWVPNPSWWAIIPIPEKDESRWYMPDRSPMSSEAQDKAIEAGNAMRVQLLALALDYRDAMLAKGGTELDLHPAHYDALDAWDQALSALRAERPPTISPKGPQEA